MGESKPARNYARRFSVIVSVSFLTLVSLCFSHLCRCLSFCAQVRSFSISFFLSFLSDVEDSSPPPFFVFLSVHDVSVDVRNGHRTSAADDAAKESVVRDEGLRRCTAKQHVVHIAIHIWRSRVLSEATRRDREMRQSVAVLLSTRTRHTQGLNGGSVVEH